MRLVSLSSGSNGNCIYVGNEHTHILVDTGISGKKTEEGLNSIDLTTNDIDAILITHEHIDHIGGLGVLSRKYGIPIYATRGTFEGIRQTKSLGELDYSLFHPIEAELPFLVNDLEVDPLRISHDAREPVAYRFYENAKKAAILTDLGTYDQNIVDALQGFDLLFLEANHDINMLQVGNYPYPLKQRILGEKGHLSNEACGRLLSRLLHDGIRYIQLGHLSHENNLPELAYETVKLEVTIGDNPYDGNDFPITVAKRGAVSQTLEC